MAPMHCHAGLSGASLVPRPERGGERAWYLLHAHAPPTPGKPGVTLLGFSERRSQAARKAQSEGEGALCLFALGMRLVWAMQLYSVCMYVYHINLIRFLSYIPTVSLAYFQLRMGPVKSCFDFMVTIRFTFIIDL